MSEEDRQQIKRVKEFVDYFYSRDISYDKVDTQEIYDIEGVLALIEKQDKIIDLMADYIAEKSNFCANKCYMNEDCHDNDCIKQYFERKVEE